MPTTSTAFRQLSDFNSVGTILGISSSDLIGFYGVTSAAAKAGTIALGSGSSFATLSTSSGALASSIAIVLNNLGLITCTSVVA